MFWTEHQSADPALSSWLERLHSGLVQRGLDLIRDKCSVGTQPPRLVFTDDALLGARATLNGDVAQIEITSGLIFRLRVLFCHILTNPEVFPEYGSSSRLRLTVLEYLDEFNVNYPDTVTAFKYPDPMPVPACPERRKFGESLAELALKFIYLHELQHHINGHLKLIHQEGIQSEAEIDESVQLQNELLTVLEWRTLEWDADSCAFFEIIKDAHGVIVEPHHHRADQYRAAVIAVSVACLTMSGEMFVDYERFLTSRSRHPPLFVRMYAMFMLAHDRSLTREYTEAVTIAAWQEALEALQYASEFMQLVPGDFPETDEMWDLVPRRMIEDFQRTWKASLYSRLLPLTDRLKLPD